MKNLLLVIGVLIAASGAFAQGLNVGDNAVDFSLKNIDNKKVSMKSFKDAKGFILIFSCNHCPYVKATEDRMIELDKKFKAMGYPVIAINPNDPKVQPEDSFEAMQVRAKEKGFTFPYLVDADQKIAKTYGATRTPQVYLVKKEGDKLVIKYIGAIDDNTRDEAAVTERFVEKAIQMLEEGKNPDPAETKAIGCTIKWRKS